MIANRMRCLFLVFIFLLLTTVLPAEEKIGKNSFNYYMEFSQILTVNIGATYHINQQWGVKGAVGLSPFCITLITTNLLGVYHFKKPADRWLIDFEFGIPLAYFDQFEGRYTDNDPIIDEPYAGWLVGASFLFSYKINDQYLGIRLGAGWWQEHQLHSGWKTPRIMPVVAIIWDF